MNKLISPSLGLFLAAFTPTAHLHSQPDDAFIDSVIAYESGEGIATDFSTGAPFDRIEATLGAPSTEIPGEFGGPVTPFSPPYLRDQLLSIGAGGRVTFSFEPPIFNQPGAPFGLDFTIFGNSGWNIVNGDFSGGGVTDGSQFGANPGETQVWVSSDGEVFHRLDPAKAPTVDGAFPTDGQGDPLRPMNPSVRPADFADADMAAIRTLYNGSAGGASFDIDWAENTPEPLSSIRYLRVEVLSGRAEIDAVAVVGAELPARSGDSRVHTDFSSNPFDHGWDVSGDTTPFRWLEDAQALEVRWDSQGPNRYFYHPLAGTLTLDDDFELSFEATFDSIEIGTTDNQPGTFPIAVSLLNWEKATRPTFFRGTGVHPTHGPRGVFEWAYFPDGGFGATVSSGAISLSNQWAFQNTFPLELPLGTRLTTRLRYVAAERTVYTEMRDGDALWGPIQPATIPEDFDAVGLDTVAISVYSDAGQNDPRFAGSVSAVGRFHQLSATAPKGPSIASILWDAEEVVLESLARGAGDYWLERSEDLRQWRTVAHIRGEAGQTVRWRRPAPTGESAIYRIRFSP